MSVPFTTTQIERLLELGAADSRSDSEVAQGTGDGSAGICTACASAVFESARIRDETFRDVEKRLASAAREKIAELLHTKHMPDSAAVIRDLEVWLMDSEGFTKVTTPTIISTKMLDRMTLTEDEPLRDQVFCVGKNRCLRPMLAPNLYIMMRELGRIAGEPVRIFETGSCFRKESQGARHLNEFTMLNCVEYGESYGGNSAERTGEDGSECSGGNSPKHGDGGGTHKIPQTERLEKLAHSAMSAVGIDSYVLEREESVVYGETIDIVADGVELASCSYGPHALDANWGVFAPWVGIGFGIERIAMVLGGHRTIKRVGRSLAFADGAPLNV